MDLDDITHIFEGGKWDVGISGGYASMRNVLILSFQVHSLFPLLCVFLGAVTPFSYLLCSL